MNIVTAQRAIIQLGNIDLEVFRLIDGSYRLSETGTEKAVDKGERSIRDFLRSKAPEACFFQDTPKEIYSVNNEKTRVSGILVDVAVAFWVYHARKGHKPAIKLLKAVSESSHEIFKNLKPQAFTLLVRSERPKTAKKKVQPYSESWYVGKMQKEIGGIREVPTESGNIDLLTSTEIIEFKEVRSWKCAIGQILVYGSYYPSHIKRIHLFGMCHESLLKIVQSHCDALNILLTWES